MKGGIQRLIAALLVALPVAGPLAAGLLAAGLLAAIPPGAVLADFSFNEVGGSVVRVSTVVRYQDELREAGHGTGFVINDRGAIATNQHVIDFDQSTMPPGAEFVGFMVPDGSFSNLLEARVVWASADLDLAVLEVVGLDRPPVILPEIEPEVGSDVYAVGFPGAGEEFAGQMDHLLEPYVTNGLVGRLLDGGDPASPGTIRRLVQHNADLNPGNSGGPLFDDCNRVVGINTFGPRATMPIGIDPQTGQPSAQGATVQGIFFSAYIGVLLEQLEANNIPFVRVGDACVPLAPGPVAGAPWDIYLYAGAALIIALGAVGVSLRKPRERVVRVVETYSQMLRRKGRSASYEAVGTPSVQRAPTETGTRWTLSGRDSGGGPVQIGFTREKLAQAARGLTLGRNSELCDFVVNDPSVSRRHARILLSGDAVMIEDMSSSNGTFLDGNQLEPYQATGLAAGARIRLGEVDMLFAEA